MQMNVLVIDVGGSHVKLARTGKRRSRRFDSSCDMTPMDLLAEVRLRTADWTYDAVSLGIPALVGPDGPKSEPVNLGCGWVDYEFQRAFKRPVRIVNDAVMQALGAYAGGRMLFLGLGTGLGTTLIVDRVVIPLELGALHDIQDQNKRAWGDRLGKKSLHRVGKRAWKNTALTAIRMLKIAFSADYVVIGGGHAGLIKPLPKGVRCGGNNDAFTGGFRLWDENIESHDAPPSPAFRVVR
jgi:hypothetical protein